MSLTKLYALRWRLIERIERLIDLKGDKYTIVELEYEIRDLNKTIYEIEYTRGI